MQDEKTICCWCCADGPITMDVYIERGAFVLGEVMKLRIEVENTSNQSLEQMKVKLKNVSKQFYYAFQCHKTSSQLLKKMI